MGLRVIEVEADSLEEARGRARMHIGEAGIVFAEAILCQGTTQTSEGVGPSVEGASQVIEKQLPAGARIQRKSVDRQPEHILIEIAADTEEAARRSLRLEKGQTLESLSLKAPGRPGFIGFGKRPPVYQARIFHQA